MATKHRAAGEGHIRQRKDGRWEARLRYTDPIDGLPKRKHFYAETRGGVVRALQEAQRRLSRNESVQDERASLERYLTWWLQHVVAPSRKPKTTTGYAKVFESRIFPPEDRAHSARQTHNATDSNGARPPYARSN